eukprot:m.14585 g.14585  ORF g.14585 m.14585 type:complete len:530 (-) comp6463_c0_seq1:162-1751(-)
MSRNGYRTVSAGSSVDESLFGFKRGATKSQPAAAPAPTQTTVQSAPAHGRRAAGAKGKETLDIVTKDGIRKLIVPSTTEQVGPLVLSKREFSRLQHAGTVRTKSAIQREREELAQAREQEMAALTLRKQETARTTAAGAPSELDVEAQQKNKALLAAAQRMIEEQEDEIRKMNEMIAQAKVYAIRDAQLAEKEAIKHELEDEERRLDDLMEYERVRALQEYEAREVHARDKLQRCALDIRTQISEREQQRLLDEELRDQETQAVIAQMRRMQADEAAQDAARRDKGRRLLEEAASVNQESLKLKAQRAEAEKHEELKIAAYLKEKQAREEELERDKELQRRAREVEVARLRALQEQAQDKVAERHALEARRQQDEIERQWRRKEAEKAEKDARAAAELLQQREHQIAAKEHFAAVQLQQDRADFMRVLQAQKESMVAEQGKQETDKARLRQHASALRDQIRTKEEQCVEERKAFFDEGARLDAEAHARRARLDEIKQRKLGELESLGIDAKYLGPIKRSIAASKTSPVH